MVEEEGKREKGRGEERREEGKRERKRGRGMRMNEMRDVCVQGRRGGREEINKPLL